MVQLKRQKEKAKPFPIDAYKDMPLSDLVLYSISSLNKKDIDATRENIIAESFELFPLKFYLLGYPEYPDCDRVWRELRRIVGSLSSKGMKKFASGNMKSSYIINEKGLGKLKEIQFKLGYFSEEKDQEQDKIIEDRRGKIGKTLWQIEKHPLYRNYLKNKEKIEIPETLLRSLLFSTMETSREKLKEKMEMLISYCESLGREDIKNFLYLCKSKHKEIFV